MILKNDKMPVSPAMVTNKCIEAINNQMHHSPVGWDGQPKIFASADNHKFRPDAITEWERLNGRKVYYDMDKGFQFSSENGVWLTFIENDIYCSYFFNSEYLCKEVSIWCPDRDLIEIYRDHYDKLEGQQTVKKGNYAWICKNIHSCDVYIWFENFEDYYIINFGTPSRYTTSKHKYAGLPEFEIDAIYNFE